MNIKVRFELSLKSHAQVAILLWTIKESGGGLDKVEVETVKGIISGTEALELWKKHVGK